MSLAVHTELHAHSAFSFLDGASAPEELAEQAAALGYGQIALTDHDGLCGSLAFAHACRDAGIRAITGAELTMGGTWAGAHVTLLCETATGYANLCRLITIAHAQTRDRRDRRADDPVLDPAYLTAHARGLVCLSGCAERGVVARLVRRGERTEAETALRRLVEIFGLGNVFVEIQRPRLRGDRRLIRDLSELAEHVGVPVVGTGNVHAHHTRRAFLQDAFVAIRNRRSLDASEAVRRGNRDSVLRAPEVAAECFADIPAAAVNAALLGERLRFDLTRDLGYRYPDFGGGLPGEDANGALNRICRYQLAARYTNARKRADAARRLDEELGLIAHHGLAGFFLLHREVLEIAREVAAVVRPAGSARRWLPPGRGRGSSVGSIVCYLTGLSHIDPVANNLFLGRFLNRDMASVPDIDLDFPRDIREGLIAEIIRRYGHEHAALVAAFPTFRMRMAVRELGAALALPPAEIERLTRLADGWSSPEGMEDEIKRLPGGEQMLKSPRWRALAFLANEASGLPRHLSQHSGGMIISARPLIELVPVVPAAFPGRQICQWDKDSCADAGFVKIDLLGLGMLSAVEECIDLISRTRGQSVDLARVSLHNPAVYAEIQAADTVGVFQIESRAQMQSLLQTRPENLEDLTVQVALIRPGPVSGGAVHPYVKHRRAKRGNPNFEPPYDHPLLAPVLRETLGVVVFQEQVLEVAIALAGFTSGQAEALRRAMSRKRSRDAMIRLWRDFRDGARARGVDDETIRVVFTKLIGFSNFGFPKAHSVAFAVLAYQSAWLRQRYPAEFLASLLNAQPMGFYPPASLVRDANRRGVKTRPPCVDASEATSSVDDAGSVRIGLRHIRGIGDGADEIVSERTSRGAFASAADLAARTALTKDQLSQLVRAGALDTFQEPRRAMLWELGITARPKRVGKSGERQLALALPTSPAPELGEPSRFERTITDYETTGISTGWHLMALVRSGLPAGTVTAAELAELPDGRQVIVAGLVVARQRPATAHGIMFMLLEDETGMANAVVRPDVYERHRAVVRADPLVVCWGKLERRDRNINVLVHRMERVETAGIERPDEASAPQTEIARLRAAVPPGQHFGQGRSR